MSKLLLIIDSDELNDDCLNCPVKYAYAGGVGCLITHKDVETEFIPDWCPLSDLPERRHSNPFVGTSSLELLQESFNDGWNACLNAITEGGQI